MYTHGYGAVVSPSNSASSVGQPNYLVGDIPPQGDIPLTRPEVYFGENLAGFSLVDAKSKEFNYPQKGNNNNFNRYHGTGGVELSSWLRRAAFALRFNDFNILISGQVTPKTKVLYLRDIRDRVKKAAPFLHYDADPYPVIANGRLVWMLDGYTTSDNYPYSQAFTGSGGLNGSFNYVRNSVKATIDAYDGTIHFYVIDTKDPVIQAYESAFPHLFTSYTKMPDAIKKHLRFPQDLFSAADRRVPHVPHDQHDDLLQQGRSVGGLTRPGIGRGRRTVDRRRADPHHDQPAAGRVVDGQAHRPDLPARQAAG